MKPLKDISLSKSCSNIKQSQVKESLQIPLENIHQLLVVCCFHKENKTIKLLKLSNVKTRFGTDL